MATNEVMATKTSNVLGQNGPKRQYADNLESKVQSRERECNNGVFSLQHSYANDPTVHNPKEQRVVISLTVVPFEVEMLNDTILNPLFSYYHSPKGYWFDAIHLNIPYTALRNFDGPEISIDDYFNEEEQKEQEEEKENRLPEVNKNNDDDQPQTMTEYPDTKTLQRMFPQRLIIINRFFMDYGPMTRYIGPLQFEQNPNTLIITFDIDSAMAFNQPNHLIYPIMSGNNFVHKDLRMLVYASNYKKKKKNNIFANQNIRHVDGNAVWCGTGDDFGYYEHNQTAVMEWRHDNKQVLEPIKVYENSIEFDFIHDSNVLVEWNDIDICRGVNGMLVKPKFFQDYFWNASEYFIGCWWDDDNFNSFNFERQGVARKEFRVKRSPHSSRKLLGSLTQVNNKFNSNINYNQSMQFFFKLSDLLSK
ncbi:hypothetical protein RFI_00054 [Reticulomyxa filosa]|uniref:Uncharacterized protein n=1 Tax=Reticulomyxa filosa TaxID=46433 RepID=X6PH39_RETFI|nr:hypothetical protein RFI_00054 [Reticulomyxa filosa]|eukprot:ETO37007.1 hypothetical protein RFI_00054 [Reticulomyxa filosa]